MTSQADVEVLWKWDRTWGLCGGHWSQDHWRGVRDWGDNMFSSQWQSNWHMKSHIVYPMPWMMAILLHISSTFGIDNIKSISEDVQNCRGGPRDLWDLWARALQEDPINLWQVSEVGKLQEEEEAVDPEPSSVLAYQDSVCLKEQITCRQL